MDWTHNQPTRQITNKKNIYILTHQATKPNEQTTDPNRSTAATTSHPTNDRFIHSTNQARQTDRQTPTHLTTKHINQTNNHPHNQSATATDLQNHHLHWQQHGRQNVDRTDDKR